VISVAFVVGFETVRLAIVSHLADTFNVGQLQRALALDPANPEIVRRLGVAYSYSVTFPDTSRGIEYLRQAAELNTHRAAYWADYGRSCDSVANLECAGQALQRAVQLAPTTPRYHWLLANHYILSDQPDKAMEEFATLLRLDPDEYAQETFTVCLKAFDSPDEIFRKALTDSATVDLKLTYAEFLCRNGRADSAGQIWNYIAAKSAAFPFPLAAPYLRRLFDLQRYEAAARVWGDLERLGVVRRSADEDQGNLIFNGGFEQPPLDAGFDWIYSDVPYLGVDFADSQAYQGKRCLRLDFTVPRNEEYQPVYTFAPVQPGRAYRFQFYARSENIESDSGPRLRVFDPLCLSCLDVASETTVGTTPWHPVGLNFTASSQTKVVQIALWRPRGRTFPNEISGTFWLDAVSLEAVALKLPAGKQ
jgi:tetratricopeptide (TPR) repeat protein